MLTPKQTPIPTLVRVKPGALDRMGIYAERHEFTRVLLFFSRDLDQGVMARLLTSFRSQNIQVLQQTPVEFISFEKATELFRQSPRNADAVVGFGYALRRNSRHGRVFGCSGNSLAFSGRIAALFEATGFWRAIAGEPFDRAEWLEAARVAPSLKADFYTVLSSRDCMPEIKNALQSDPNLRLCFRP